MISFTALAQPQSGKASFYSKSFSGRKTASGERIHHDSLTCAHRTYPFGTLLQVTNPVKGRVIELSVRAAQEMGIIAQGIAPVIVEKYEESVIPYKPAEVFSKPELDISTNDGSAAKPIWVELREQMKKKQHEEKKKR